MLLDNVRGPLQNDGDPAGGFGLPDSQPVSDKVEQYYVRRISPLPADTRLLVLTAAAEPLGDTALLRHAAEKLALDRAARALAFGLLKLGGRARFTHSSRARPSTASPRTRTGRRVHGDLADVANAGADAIAAPDTSPARRRAPTWTSRLSTSAWAQHARARGGLAATTACFQRAAALSSDPARRAHRTLAAAKANLNPGRFNAASDLLASAELRTLDESWQAQVDILRGQIAMFPTFRHDASAALLNAVRRLERLGVGLARETYLDA